MTNHVVRTDKRPEPGARGEGRQSQRKRGGDLRCGNIRGRVHFLCSLLVVINDVGGSVGRSHLAHLKLNKKIRPSSFNNRRREEGVDRRTAASDWKISGNRRESLRIAPAGGTRRR